MKKIFISPGDPSGIGPEITLKALAKNKSIQDHFIIGGDANYLESFAKKLKLSLRFAEEGSKSEGLKIKHFPLDRYYTPEEFKELGDIAKSKGFLLVSSSPLTRSSYHADEDFAKLKKNRSNIH